MDGRTPDLDGRQPGAPFENSYWVLPGSFLAGHYPGSLDPDELRWKLEGLLDAGIQTILNLMEEGEMNIFGALFAPYEPAFQEMARNRGIEPATVRIPIRDMKIPDRATMKRILDTIDRSLKANSPLYLHCLGGRGRTGTVVGCFLRRHNLAEADRVLALIRRMRQRGFGMVGDSPETRKQRRLVRDWSPGE